MAKGIPVLAVGSHVDFFGQGFGVLEFWSFGVLGFWGFLVGFGLFGGFGLSLGAGVAGGAVLSDGILRARPMPELT